MKRLRAFLADRKASQRGSVLSGVLIMTAFIAIIAGALTTELSGTFLLSNIQMTRTMNEATVNSSMELALNQLQQTQLFSPCPAMTPVSINGRMATSTLTNCWPSAREPQQFVTASGSSSAFNLDGVQAQVGSFRDYVVINSGGKIFDYRFGAASPRWSLPVSGSVSASPLVIPSSTPNHYLDVIPLAGGGWCSPDPNCLAVRDDGNTSSVPGQRCTVPATYGPVLAAPGASSGNPGYIYYADGGQLEASDLSGSDCDPVAATAIPSSRPVVAGPLVESCGGRCDALYLVESDSGSSTLYWYTFSGQNGHLSNLNGSVALPWGSVSGMASSSATLPASIAITSAGGGIALVNLASNGGMSLGNQAAIGGGIGDAPFWCTACGNRIVVGGLGGAVNVYDSGLGLLASYATGSSVSTTPGADGAGNIYAAAADGYLHELQLRGNNLTQVRSYGPMADFGAAPQVGPCPAGICIYMGGTDANVYLVSLDARDAVITTCLSNTPPACSGANPRLWAQVEVGAAGNPQSIHIQGWSYYSA